MSESNGELPEPENTSIQPDNDPLAPFRTAVQGLLPAHLNRDAIARRAQKMRLKSSGRSTIYAVYNCERLPAEEALRTWVLATTDGDTTEEERFVQWRRRLAGDDASDDTAVEDSELTAPVVDDDAARPADTRRWPRDVFVAAVAMTVTAAVSIPVTAAVVSRPESSPVQDIRVVTGSDPQQCVGDAMLANPAVTVPPMRLKVLYSPGCSAVWGKVERLDSLGFGNSITVTVYREDQGPKGPDAQTITESNTGNAYTPVIVRKSPAEHICVTATMTVDRTGDVTGLGKGQPIQAPGPQCT